MVQRLGWATALAVAAALTAGVESAMADTVKVLAAGAVKAAIVELAKEYAQTSGDTVETVYDTVGALRDRVLNGEAADVVILSAPAIAALDGRGKLVAGSIVAVGRTGVGIAARRGSTMPGIDTPEQLKAALLAAASVGHADPARGATAGTHFRKVVEALGLAGPLAGRLRVYPFGGDVIAAVGRGELQLGISQATEIVAHPEVAFVGLLPDPYQVWTTYQAALAADRAGGHRFIDMLSGPQAKMAFADTGFVEPAR